MSDGQRMTKKQLFPRATNSSSEAADAALSAAARSILVSGREKAAYKRTHHGSTRASSGVLGYRTSVASLSLWPLSGRLRLALRVISRPCVVSGRGGNGYGRIRRSTRVTLMWDFMFMYHTTSRLGEPGAGPGAARAGARGVIACTRPPSSGLVARRAAGGGVRTV